MRTTISLDDRLAQRVRRRAASQGLSVSAYVAAILDDAIKGPVPSAAKPFRLITVGGSGPAAGVDLDRPRSLDILDDEERWASRT
ncbi:MAG: hypothetical protein OXN89_03200 [Bryobacterales bacterium]|nr:hypothetical protein [Bryobacterales bacterium]